jgi:NAD(P)-dependent dehydrogenase (short-subunit alcohol dehydrogenase family)
MPPKLPLPLRHGLTALVTGGGSGINLCVTQALLSRGCNVVVADIGLRPEAETTLSQHQGRAVFQQMDVRSWKALEKAFAVAEGAFDSPSSGVDIVVPGAGIYEPVGFFFFFLLSSSHTHAHTHTHTRTLRFHSWTKGKLELTFHTSTRPTSGTRLVLRPALTPATATVTQRLMST